MKGQVEGKDVNGGMTGAFEEILENERIVMTDSFADETGRAISPQEAGMTGHWPRQIFITFEFEAAGKDASAFHLAQEGIPDKMQKDCIQGVLR